MLFVQARLAAHFFRLGRKWVKAGALVDIEEYAEEQWDVLKAETNLHVRKATKEDIAALSGELEVPKLLSPGDVMTALVEVIPGLLDGEFTKDGKPKIAVLRKAVEIPGKYITAETVNAALEKLTAGGFKPPTAD